MDIKALIAECGGDVNKALALASQRLAEAEKATAAAIADAKAARSGMAGKLTLRVSTKGGVSVYGLGRWPVTLYREQWERLIETVPAIQRFIEANKASLKAKGDATAEVEKTA